jgi:hypothetical protein
MKTTRAPKPELKRALDAGLADLAKITDEIRLQLHLASLDAQSEWKKLEPRLAALEASTEKTVTEATRAALTDAIKALVRFRASLAERQASRSA